MNRSALLNLGQPLQAEALFTPAPYEVDFTGFLSNTVAPRWMECLWLKLVDDHFADQELFDPEQLSVIARTAIDYLRPLRMGSTVRGQAGIFRCLRSSWSIAFTFKDVGTGELHMRAQQVGVFINAVTFVPHRIPPAIKEWIERTFQLQQI